MKGRYVTYLVALSMHFHGSRFVRLRDMSWLKSSHYIKISQFFPPFCSPLFLLIQLIIHKTLQWSVWFFKQLCYIYQLIMFLFVNLTLISLFNYYLQVKLICEYKGVLHKVLPEIRQVCFLNIAGYLNK